MKKYNIDKLKEKTIGFITKKDIKNKSYEVDVDEDFLGELFNIEMEAIISFMDI